MQAMTIKHLISAGRRQLGMTEQRFADALGVSRSAVQQWESGATAPRRSHQQRVADLIGITVGELMAGVASKYPEQDSTQHAAEEPTATYHAGVMAEARKLLDALSEEGQREALTYMRLLALRYPVEQRHEGEKRDTFPTPKKAA